MDEQLMRGILWGGVLLSSIPILLGVGVGMYVLWRYRLERARREEASATGGATAGGAGE
ncbi:MAG: hypothetical protein ACRELV_10955 [Longimicrobiales bacterium]